jgi:hypothetical protein
MALHLVPRRAEGAFSGLGTPPGCAQSLLGRAQAINRRPMGGSGLS